MGLTEAELEAKRARADHLRREIRSLRTDGTSARLEAEREVTASELDREIASLERQVMVETKSVGGSVEDAMAAMQRAEELEKMLTPQPREVEEPVNVEDEGEPIKVEATEEVQDRLPLDADGTSADDENGGNQ